MAGWVKAPTFADDPARVDEIRAQTEVDKSRYLVDGMAPVDCQACGACVLVRKNSLAHTSIQWTGDPARSCLEYTAPARTRGTPGSCGRLRNSIEHAVMEGMVTVVDSD